MLRVLLAGFLAAVAAGALAQDIACPAPATAKQVVELLFGRNIGGRHRVSEARWSRFVRDEITPHFPDGLTVLDASGQWRDSGSGRIVREKSKLVMLIVDPANDARARIDAIVAAYKTRFAQQSVAVVTRSACVAF